MNNSRTIKTWHEIVATRDIKKLEDILNDNVVFHSPIVYTPQIGKEITKQYLRAALYVLCKDSFKYVREVINENNAVLEFTVEIDNIVINGVDMITWDENEKITEFKVMIRPLKAINLVHQKMAEMLKSRK